MENSARDRAQVYGNMEGATQREASQNNYTTIDFGRETQVFPSEDDRRGVQEDDATRTKTSKPDKTNEVKAKLAGSKRTLTVTAEGLTVSLPPPTKRQKTPKDPQKRNLLKVHRLKVQQNTRLKKVAVRSCGQLARVFLIWMLVRGLKPHA